MKKALLLSVLIAPSLLGMDVPATIEAPVLPATATLAFDMIMIRSMQEWAANPLPLCKFDREMAFNSPLAAVVDIMNHPEAAPSQTAIESVRQLIDKNTATALVRVAAYKGYSQTIAFLAKNNLINPTDELRSLLFVGHAYPDDCLLITVQALLDAGANPNETSFMASFITTAIYQSKPAVAELLLNRGAHPCPRRVEPEYQPLRNAESKGYRELAALIRAAIERQIDAPESDDENDSSQDN